MACNHARARLVIRIESFRWLMSRLVRCHDVSQWIQEMPLLQISRPHAPHATLLNEPGNTRQMPPVMLTRCSNISGHALVKDAVVKNITASSHDTTHLVYEHLKLANRLEPGAILKQIPTQACYYTSMTQDHTWFLLHLLLACIDN